LGLAPDLARAGTYRRFLVKKLAVAVALVAAIGLFLGYLGSTKLGSGGFGSYAADLSTLVDPDDRSRFVADIVTAPDAIGGYGYVGLGGLVLLCTAAFLCRREARLRTPGDDPPPTPERLPARFVYGAIGVLTVYGVLPQVRVFNRVTFDFSRITDRLSSLTEVFRVNGRFIWPLAWLLLMLAAAQTVRARRARTAVLVAALVLLVQIADVIPYPALWRPAGAAEFAAARRALEAEQQSGGTGIEVQPPVVIPGCYDGTIKFDQLGDVLLAAAVLGLPVNSGYTAREEPAAVAQICEAQARAFREGSFSPQTIYVLRDASIPPGLTCHPLTTGLVACRSSTTT